MLRPLATLRALALMWALAICPVSTLLLWVAVSLQGRVFAAAAIALGAAPLLAVIELELPWSRRLGKLLLIGWAMAMIWLLWVSPDGHSRQGARVTNEYVGGVWSYQSKALGALLPEADQFMLGFKLVPLIDPLFNRRQSKELSAMTSAIYERLESDVDFRALGSVMPDAYDDLLGRRYDRGHYFLYVPTSLNRKAPSPTLVFLHGSGGNFKAYTWLLSRVADRLGLVLISPSDGMGDWGKEKSMSILRATLNDVERHVALKASQIHLAGLSNGGLGVTRLAASELGSQFRSLILLSPVCDTSALESNEFTQLAKTNEPVLMITGANDDRVPLGFVEKCAAQMSRAGAHVDLHKIDDANHFLFFSHQDAVLSLIEEWLTKQIRLSGQSP